MSSPSAILETVEASRQIKAAAGAVGGAPGVILRLEGAVALGAAVFAYSRMGGGWWLFAALILVPDLSMLGYLAGRRVGALAYNFGHSYLLPAALGGWGLAEGQPLAVSLALIWVAHVGFDRLLGYGLKYTAGFGVTHLGLKGRARG